MIPIIGFTLLLLIFFGGIILPILNYRLFHKKNLKELQRISFFICASIFVFAILSKASLIYSFIISNYSIANVYNNSHHLKPLIYKISGSWGNHEGSMLLLILIICGYNFFFNLFSKISLDKKIIITSTQSAIAGIFAAYTAFVSNPFEIIFPAPLEGLGLNPVLQDIGLAFHPPMLYMGYIGFSLIFSFAISALITKKIDKDFAFYIKPWLFFSWSCLTLGIGLGAWWAYRELGWGGYWFWDPVENVSLMPWLCATALIHCVKILEKKEIFKLWTIFLAILTFICCLLGIFLVRSGILTSVHSFAIDAKRGFFAIALIFIIGGFGMLLFGTKMSHFEKKSGKIAFLSQIGTVLLNNYFLIIALFIVFLGTTYPIFLRGFFNEFISIGASYYNQVFSILIIPFLIFLSTASSLNYEKNTKILKLANLRNTAYFIASLVICLSLCFYFKKFNFLHIIILTLAIFCAFSNLKSKNLIMKFAHLGFSLVIVGIITTSSFGLIREVNLKQKESLKIANYNIIFNNINYITGKNFVARQGDFMLLKNDKKIAKLKPELRYYPISKQTTNESFIKHSFFGDIYLVIGTKDEQENYAVRVYFKPFIYLIWLGCLLIFSSGMIGIIKRLNLKISK